MIKAIRKVLPHTAAAIQKQALGTLTVIIRIWINRVVKDNQYPSLVMQLQTCGGMQYSEPDSTFKTVFEFFPFYMILKAILDSGQFGLIQTLVPEQVPQTLQDADHYTSPCFYCE